MSLASWATGSTAEALNPPEMHRRYTGLNNRWTPMQAHIFIATPCYGGVVTQGYMQSVCMLMAQAPSLGLDLTLGLLGQDALITRSRNTLLAQFLNQTEATHILFIDADIAFEPDQVIRLLEAGKPIIGGMYPLKAYYWDADFRARLTEGEPIETAGLHYVGELEPGSVAERAGDYATARYAGTGFLLIERQAIERLIAAYPETRYRQVHAYPATSGPGIDHYALFDCMIDQETGTYLSEDFTFCARWRALGQPLWLDTRSRLTHSGPASFHGQAATRQSLHVRTKPAARAAC